MRVQEVDAHVPKVGLLNGWPLTSIGSYFFFFIRVRDESQQITEILALLSWANTLEVAYLFLCSCLNAAEVTATCIVRVHQPLYQLHLWLFSHWAYNFGQNFIIIHPVIAIAILYVHPRVN